MKQKLSLTITSTPDVRDEKYVIDNLLAHNSTFDVVDIHPLLVTVKDDAGKIIGGLISKTWWGGLEIQYLWVHENYRKEGVGNRLMEAAEKEAIKRGCHMAYVDTFSFQAVGFYEKNGYKEYGKLYGYVHRHTRHYLSKLLP